MPFRYYVPYGWMIDRVPSCTTTFEATTSSDARSLSESLGVSVSAYGGFMGLSFSASTEFRQQEDSMRTSSSKIIKSSATCQDFTVTMKYDHYPGFSESFKRLLRRLKQSVNDPKSVKDNLYTLLEQFGTHYVKKLHFGAVYGFMYTLSSSEYEQLTEESLSVETQAYSGFFDAGLSVGVDKSKSEASSKFREKASKKEFALGAKPPNDGEISTWTSSVLENPYPIKYKLSSIDELFDVDLTEIGDFLTAVEERKIRKKLQFEILPGYCSWLNKNDARIKATCPNSPNKEPRIFQSLNELSLFQLRGVNSLLTNEKYSNENYIHVPGGPSERVCYERCMNAMGCTRYNHLIMGGYGFCFILIDELDQGHTEHAIKRSMRYYSDVLKRYWEDIDSAIVGVIVPKLERPAIQKGVTFRDNPSLHKRRCHVSATGFTAAYLCMNVCSWDVDCLAYESTERGGLRSNCFIYYELSDRNWAFTDVGLFETVLMSYKAKIKNKAMAQNSFPQGVPCNEV